MNTIRQLAVFLMFVVAGCDSEARRAAQASAEAYWDRADSARAIVQIASRMLRRIQGHQFMIYQVNLMRIFVLNDPNNPAATDTLNELLSI